MPRRPVPCPGTLTPVGGSLLLAIPPWGTSQPPRSLLSPLQYFQHYLLCRCALGCLVCMCLASPPSRSSAPHRAASVSCVPSCRACGGLRSCGDAAEPVWAHGGELGPVLCPLVCATHWLQVLETQAEFHTGRGQVGIVYSFPGCSSP